ncbi:MAG TPA: hypothetical protein VI112_13735 [Bacteroidia bacterium]|jgi:hypothetical protein
MPVDLRGKKFTYENWNTYTCLPIDIHELVVNAGDGKLKGTFTEKYYGSGGTGEEQKEIQQCRLEIMSEGEEGTWVLMTTENGTQKKLRLRGEEFFYY